MKTVSISAAKNTFSALVRRVRAGETVLITNRGVPVARFEPIADVPSGESNARLESLARRGLVILPKRRPTADVLKGAVPSLPAGVSLSAVVIEER